MSLLDNDAISAGLAGLRWERQGNELVREHKSRDFAGAMEFVNAVAERAEAANHHPDIDIRWNTVTLRLSTHSAGGLTQADLDLAREIDGVAAGG
jgi:4a-hydroxytetrahydrobiopterin dehydratase